MRIVRTLSRIRAVIAEAVRMYESSGDIDRNSLNAAKLNLRRISSEISHNSYETLLEAIEALLMINGFRDQQQRIAYVAPRVSSG